MMKPASERDNKRCKLPCDGPALVRRVKSRYLLLFCLPFACSVLATGPDIGFVGNRTCGAHTTNISCPVDQLLIGLRYNLTTEIHTSGEGVQNRRERLDQLEPECARYAPSDGRWLEISMPAGENLPYHKRCPQDYYAYAATGAVFALIDSIFLSCRELGISGAFPSVTLEGAGPKRERVTAGGTCPEGQAISSLEYIESGESEGFCAIRFNCQPFPYLATEPDISFIGSRSCSDRITSISCPENQFLIGLRYNITTEIHTSGEGVHTSRHRLDQLEPECARYAPSDGRWMEISMPAGENLPYHKRCPQDYYAYAATGAVFALIDCNIP